MGADSLLIASERRCCGRETVDNTTLSEAACEKDQVNGYECRVLEEGSVRGGD